MPSQKTSNVSKEDVHFLGIMIIVPLEIGLLIVDSIGDEQSCTSIIVANYTYLLIKSVPTFVLYFCGYHLI
uniref:Uncharacterized protein n=1 Tax=Romanomermis culicivorax TaxID=13658 RepID=A0A915L3M4_ROMCU